jgi:S-(hydroxymethyl)glutathione dehydrogenase / alcohol dehydrogenase
VRECRNESRSIERITGKFDIEDVEISSPTGREVLVGVKACGLCHSDLHLAEADYGTRLPAVLGHEAGVVKQIGPGVRDFTIGDHVVRSLLQSCGHCGRCVSGSSFQCENPDETLRQAADGSRLMRGETPVTSGFGTGGFPEFALIHENQIVKVPKELSFPQASLLGCSVITGPGAVMNSAKVRPGETVVVVSVGGVGLNAIAGARLAGASQIIAVDLQPEKKALALRFGATHFVNSKDHDAVSEVKSISHGGVDHSFEVVGLVQTTQQAVQMVRTGGSAYIIGIHRPGLETPIQGLDFVVRQVDLRGVYMG